MAIIEGGSTPKSTIWHDGDASSQPEHLQNQREKTTQGACSIIARYNIIYIYIAPIYHIEIQLSPVEHVAKMQTLILGIGFEWDNDNIEDQNIEKQTLQDHWGPLKICLQ